MLCVIGEREGCVFSGGKGWTWLYFFHRMLFCCVSSLGQSEVCEVGSDLVLTSSPHHPRDRMIGAGKVTHSHALLASPDCFLSFAVYYVFQVHVDSSVPPFP